MAWCRQAASHYLSQCCPRSLSPYGVTRPQWVKCCVWYQIVMQMWISRIPGHSNHFLFFMISRSQRLVFEPLRAPRMSAVVHNNCNVTDFVRQTSSIYLPDIARIPNNSILRILRWRNWPEICILLYVLNLSKLNAWRIRWEHMNGTSGVVQLILTSRFKELRLCLSPDSAREFYSLQQFPSRERGDGTPSRNALLSTVST